MTIYFSPSYTSGTYIDLDAMPGGTAMDTSVCDVAGLVNLIELHSGKYYPETGTYELCVKYMKALKKMDNYNPKNVLHRSLEIDAISTAKACLDWRNKLILAGWNGDMTFSPRLKALADAERYFDSYTLADRIMQLPEIIKSSGVAKDIRLIIPYEQQLMHPAVCAIVDTLKDNGAKVEIMPDTPIPSDCNLKKLADWYDEVGDITTINEPDSTVEVIEFENRDKVIEWLATLPKSGHEVWISDHCADIDMAMIANDKPACGSMADSGLPPTVQIAMLAVSQFISPVDINKLVAWLRLPRSPLPNVRFKIASMLLSEGGYDPTKLEECLNSYQITHPDADIPAIKKRLKLYLHISDGESARAKDFYRFICNVLGWAEEECESEYVAELHAQYNDLINRLKAILLLAEMHPGDTIDNVTLEKWMMMCCDSCTYPQYTAQKGAHTVISNPGNIIGDAEHVLWCSFSNFTPQAMTYDFLSTKEIDSLKTAGCRIYEPDVEAKAISTEQRWPLHHCRHLTIIEMVDKAKDEVRGTMSQQLRSIPEDVWNALKAVVSGVKPNASIAKLDDNFFADMPTEITIGKSSLIKFREKESYSSLEKLVQRPMDYVMEYILNLKPINDNEIAVSTSVGNVAHYVIEKIFTPETDIATIKAKWESQLDATFKEGLMQKGLILLLPENRIELIRLETGLRDAIEALIDIIMANELTVIDCENTFVANQLLPNNIELGATLDMRLRGANGSQVIIDFKWASNPYRYHNKIKEHKAMQLDIYTNVLSKVLNGDSDVISGYFVMPICKLFTCCEFKGRRVEHINIDHFPADVMDKIHNAYAYRREQLANGVIEMAYGMSTKNIQYANDTDKRSLYPLELKYKSAKKADNTYSNYKSFNS